MQHMSEAGSERKHERKIIKDVFMSSHCCGQLSHTEVTLTLWTTSHHVYHVIKNIR